MSVQVLNGDCLDVLATLPDQSVNCCVTSPPYYGLRDYGHDGQIGLEDTPQAYVEKLVAVFAQVRRVLRADGTCWLNLGDTYASQGGLYDSGETTRVRDLAHMGGAQKRARINGNGIKPKDLLGIPWRVAFALQADGWWLRQDIIWHKPNPMPESVKDRCTKAHEYLFLLTKSERYWFDAEAIAEPFADERMGASGVRDGVAEDYAKSARGGGDKGLARYSGKGRVGRNRRSVWAVATQPYSGAHFATMPPDLARDCILAGCPVGGTVLDPFGGAGTTGLAADRIGRNAILIELNPVYASLAQQRITADAPLLVTA